MRSTTAVGNTFRSAEPTEPRVPEGATRRPLSSTRVRVAPRPRSAIVLAPGPPSVTKPPNALLICAPPVVTPVPCRAAVVELKPDIMVSSRVITRTGEVELKVSRWIREPVTVSFSTAAASSETLESTPAATRTSCETPSLATL